MTTPVTIDAARIERFTRELVWENSFLDAPQWPAPLGEKAYHGLAGEFVRTLEPHTESDPVALLSQFLAFYGNLIGRRAHIEIEASRHYGNLFVVLVGPTAKARKGTAEAHVRRIMRAVDETWASKRIKSGLSTGEGLVWQVRDAIERREPIKEKGRITGYQTVVADEGEEDKRLLVIEPELARVFQVLEREGSTLSAILREAWDKGDLSVLTKASTAHATGAHVTLIGHITREELVRVMTSTTAANGLGNRFLWFAVRRSKLLPRGGKWQSIDWAPFLRRLTQAVQFGSQARRIEPDAEAWEYWDAAYEKLSNGRPGMLGAITARAEAQVLRLALLYALLDLDELIRISHLEAALELWRYCYESARWIWGEATGDPVQDAILEGLRQAGEKGLTRTQIYSDLFHRHVSRARLESALCALAAMGMARAERRESAGRPVEVWLAMTNRGMSQ